MWKIAIQIYQCLNGLHSCNILHRDLHCQNIFLLDDLKFDTSSFCLTCFCRIKVADVGLYKSDSIPYILTSTTGSDLCVAPEVIRVGKYSTATDVWSAGCVLYQVCSGKAPFSGTRASELTNNILNASVAPFVQPYTRDLCQLIFSMLEKDPSKRLTLPQFFANRTVISYAQNYQLALPQAAPAPSAAPFDEASITLSPAEEDAVKKEVWENAQRFVASQPGTTFTAAQLYQSWLPDQLKKSLEKKKSEFRRSRSSSSSLNLSSSQTTVSSASQSPTASHTPSHSLSSLEALQTCRAQDFELDRKNWVVLGEGSFGKAYKVKWIAHQPPIDVCIKTIPLSLAEKFAFLPLLST